MSGNPEGATLEDDSYDDFWDSLEVKVTPIARCVGSEDEKETRVGDTMPKRKQDLAREEPEP